MAVLLQVAVASSARAAPPPASPHLPPHHWAVLAAERLEELGLLDRYLPAQHSVPLRVVARALAEGEVHARELRPELVPLARAWRERFAEEWSGVAEELAPGGGAEAARGATAREPSFRGRGLHALGGQLALGYQAGSTRELPGAPAAGPAALHLTAPGSDPFLEAGGAVALGPLLAVGLRAEATPWDARLASGDVAIAAGPLALAAGRGHVAYGPGLLGAPVSSGLAALDRLELATAAPLELPLGLGELAFDLAMAALGSSARHPDGPLLLLGQVSWRPHPRLTFFGARGYMFGGEAWHGISPGDALLGLSGLGNIAGNNVFSLALRYRLPTDRWQPLTLKVDLGTDDNLGALLSWPGLVAGLSAPALGSLPVGLSAEVAHYGRGMTVFRHDPFPWYTHGGTYSGGWAVGEAPLGDALGGNGDALRAELSADLLKGLLRLRGRGEVRWRASDNLYAPQAGARSAVLTGELELRRGRYTTGASGAYERGGSGWERREVRAWVGASL